MHLEGDFIVNADRDDAYAFLTDPARLGPHMPDVKEITIDDPDRFTVVARVGISHIKGTMTMKLEIRDRQPPVGTTVAGKGAGLGSMVNMVTSFTLEPLPAGSESGGRGRTHVRWRGDLTIAGKLAAFGPQGLLDRIARKNIDAFIEGIKTGLEAQAR